MSGDNMATIRRGYELFAVRDLEAVAAMLAEDVEITDTGGLGFAGSAAGTRAGPEGFLCSAQEAFDAFEDFRVEAREFIEAGDAVVVPVRISGRGRGSGAEMETWLTHLWVFSSDGGKVVRNGVYETTEEALAAAGRRR